MSKVVVGLDGSRISKVALERAVELFRGDTEFVLVNVLPEDAFKPEERAQERMLTKAVERMAESGGQAKTIAARGDAASELIRVAEETQAIAIVVGSRGVQVQVSARGNQLDLGRVARAVVDSAPLDVFIVRDAYTLGGEEAGR